MKILTKIRNKVNDVDQAIERIVRHIIDEMDKQ